MSQFTMKFGSDQRFEAGSWAEFLHEIYIGLLVGMGHVYKIFLEMPWQYLFGSSQVKQLPPAEELKVVGVGFGRTGTYSLKLALEELGMPTLHTQHLYEPQNEAIFEMWTQDIFLPSLKQGKAQLGRPNLSIIPQQGYQATMDFPTALYWEQILEEYPNCKFILTTRQSEDVWFRSWESMTSSISTPAHIGGMFLTGVQRYSIYLRWLFAMVNRDDSYLTSTLPKTQQIPEQAKISYQEHNAKIRSTIPPERLLEYSVQEGWQPLCDFLEISDCPTTPFPKTNSARSVQVQSVSSTVVPAVIVILLVFRLSSHLFRKLTGRTVGQWIQYQTNVLPFVLKKTLIKEDYKKHDGDHAAAATVKKV